MTDILVAGGRQIRALRHLSASEEEAAGSKPSSPKETEVRRAGAEERPALERKRFSSGSTEKESYRVLEAKAKGKAVKGERSEEETEVPIHHHRPLGGGSDHRRPPEPEGPPPSHKKRTYVETKQESRERQTEVEKRRHPWHRGTKRAGRKHQRLGRLLKDPQIRVHRKLPTSFLEVRSEDLGKEALYRY